MIIQGKYPLEVGSRILNKLIMFPDERYHSVRIIVRRKATKEEYLEFVKQTQTEHLVKNINTLGPYFYEVDSD